jgi:Skp family chaperone for outer membrane proteins|tara:strand:- start:110574 stop:111107 length:534 start_codon:yes stop_codon:yes gene_type:complete
LVPALSLLTGPGFSQQVDTPVVRTLIQSPILTIDSDRVFNESAFGLRVASEIDAESAKLSAENRKIEKDLETEEERLTALRKTMNAEAFRALANAFDEKVQQTRLTQAAKSRALNDLVDQEREVFLDAASPVLEKLMRDTGAAVILERRSVFVSANAIDITNQAIARLNASVGSGKD